MSGRSNWEFKNSALNRLDPSRRAEAEARAASRKGVDNEAIKVDSEAKKPTPVEPKATPGLLGGGAAAGAARGLRTRKQRMDEEL